MRDDGTSARILTQNSRDVGETVEAIDYFGAALGSVDMDGDGRSDVVVGVPVPPLRRSLGGPVRLAGRPALAVRSPT